MMDCLDTVGHLIPFPDWISMLVTMESVLIAPPPPTEGPPSSWGCARPGCDIPFVAHAGYYGKDGHPWEAPRAPEMSS